jgi:CRISPR-associated endonuclease/helicase Cas3
MPDIHLTEPSPRLDASVSDFWGKAEPASVIPYHPLAYHSLEVAAVGHVFLQNNPQLVSVFANAFGSNDTGAVRRTLVALLGIHDVGKYAATFQSLSPEVCGLVGAPVVAAGGYSKKGGTGHDSLGLWLWEFKDLAATLFHVTDMEVSALLGSGVFGHHGNPVSSVNLVVDGKRKFGKAGLAAAVAFSTAFLDIVGGPFIAPVDGAHAKKASFLISGLTHVCDHLASNVDLFSFRTPDQDLASYWIYALGQANDAVARSGLVSAAPPAEGGFQVLYPALSPSPLQELADKVCLPRQFLMIMEDVPGSGKTEAAMTVASRAIAGRVSRGMFMGLPTTATTDAQAKRQAATYRALYSVDEAPSMTLAHGNVDTGSRNDGMSCADWIADDRRKRLLADVCVGTVDQALMGALPARYASIRLFGLSGKLLVLDEVHCYDVYTTALIASLIKLHGALGGSVVLLSATLTAETKRRFSEAFRIGSGVAEPDPNHLGHPAYPLLTVLGPQGSKVYFPEKARRAPPTKTVRVIHTVTQAQQALLECVRTGGCALWVRVTVNAATEAAETLSADHVDTTLYHARFTDHDRNNIQNAILHRYGKNSTGAERRGGLVVATAIIEQSLDLDFDLVVVDLKPMDSLIQALGRAIRHSRNSNGDPIADGSSDGRPAREMIILSPDPADVRGADWYGELLGKARFIHTDPSVLWRTANALSRDGLVSYDNMRSLVEEAYNNEILAPDCFTEEVLVANGRVLAESSMARHLTNGFTPEVGYVAGGGYWDDSRVPTRLGESVEVVLVEIQEDEVAPYHGSKWSSGKMRLDAKRVTKLPPEALSNPRLTKVEKAFKFAIVVPVIRQGNEFFHHGSRLNPFVYDSKNGLRWR